MSVVDGVDLGAAVDGFSTEDTVDIEHLTITLAIG
jgi:hypothetical protein